jgi:outer membrane protein assembly factor BamB
MPSFAHPQPIPGVADATCMLTPVPVPAGALLPYQDGMLVCRETSGATRWRLRAFPPDTAPAGAASLRRIGSSSVVLDDADQWTCAGLDTGEILWGPVPFGSSRLARLGDDQLYWNYVPVEAGQVLAGLNPGSGVVRVAGRCERWGYVLLAASGAVLAVERTELVRRDARTADVIWRKELLLGPGSESAAADASGCLVAGPGLILPIVRRGLVAFDYAGQRVWTLPLGDAVFSVALAGDMLHMVSPERYLRVAAATGRVLSELDMEEAAHGELLQVHSATVLGDVLFAADLSGLVFALDLSTRSIPWTFRARARIPAGCPLSVGDGQLWAIDLNGGVYGFTL